MHPISNYQKASPRVPFSSAAVKLPLEKSDILCYNIPIKQLEECNVEATITVENKKKNGFFAKLAKLIKVV